MYDLYEEYATAYNEIQSKQGQSTDKRREWGGTSSSQGRNDTSGIGKNIITSHSMYLSFVRQSDTVQPIKSELDSYLEESVYIYDSDAAHFNALEWWKVNQLKYPRLSKMAAEILSIPITTMASESTFSAGGRVIDDRQASLSIDTVEMLLCASDWIWDLHGLKKQLKVNKV